MQCIEKGKIVLCLGRTCVVAEKGKTATFVCLFVESLCLFAQHWRIVYAALEKCMC